VRGEVLANTANKTDFACVTTVNSRAPVHAQNIGKSNERPSEIWDYHGGEYEDERQPSGICAM
jgi:hypothetical protein